jgi:predicted nucleic acid-binding protein
MIVCDTGPLQYLIQIGCDPVLPALFGRVLVPSVVVDRELSNPSAPEVVRRWAASPPAWLDGRDASRIEPIPSLGLVGFRGDGDRAVISLALEIGADFVLMNDLRARREAKARRLSTLWTLEVLDVAAERGLVGDLADRLDTLVQNTNFHVGEKARRAIEAMKRRDFERQRDPTQP